MDILKTIVVSGIMALLIAGGTVVVTAPTPEAPVDNLGAAPGPDTGYTYFGVGGVRQHSASKSLQTGTTTVCSIKSPNATSSLLFGGIRFVVGSTTASTVTLAKSTNGTATSSSLGTFALAANAQGVGTASTTGNHIFAPNQYFVVSMGGGTGTYSPTGTCKATFVEM